MTTRDLDDALDLDAAQHHALATFEHASEVFADLGGARADDAAKIAAWVDGAVSSAAPVAAATTAASKIWTIGAVVAVVAGAALIGREQEPTPTTEAAIEIAAPVNAPAPAPVPVEAPESAPEIPEPPASAPLLTPKEKPTSRQRPSAPTTSPLSAAELLRQAAAARRSGETTRALELYRRIGREFASSREDKVARVAIGRLELADGHADRALAAFDAYLRDHSTGNLAEEASFGRASALRALGRSSDERKALNDFVARFPDSVNVERAMQRLAALGS